MPETRYEEVYRDGQLMERRPYTVSDAALERERQRQRRGELRGLFQQAAGTGTVPAPDLTALVLKLAEYLGQDEG